MPSKVPEFQFALVRLAQQLERRSVALVSRISRLAQYEAMQFITDAYPELARPFITSAIQLTLQWYDEQPAPMGNTAFIPRPAEPAPDDQLAISGRWALTQANPGIALGGNATKVVFNGSRDTVLANVDAESGTRWVRYASANACSFCRVMATKGAVYLSADSATKVTGRTPKPGKEHSGQTRGTREIGQLWHDNCVPAGTLVSGPRTEAAYRRAYEGEAVVVHTASGQKLTITPNHPVLTDQGWVPAGLLNQGDNVIRSLRSDAGAAAVPHKHQRPAPIEDVWGSLAVNSFGRVPGSAEDFHGDGSDREVEIVWADGHLDSRFDAALSQELQEDLFAATLGRGPGASLAVLGEQTTRLPASLCATHSIMSSLSDPLPLLRGSARHAECVGVGGLTGGYAHLDKSATYDHAVRAEQLGALQLRDLLADIEFPQPVGIDSQTVSARFDPAGFEFTQKGVGGYASLGRGLAQRLSGDVELDRVVHLERISFAGHVYNLQTENGWYAADSIIVSNCHCIAVPVRRGDIYQPPPYAKQWQQDYKDAVKAAKADRKAKGKSGAVDLTDIVNAMDRAQRAKQVPAVAVT